MEIRLDREPKEEQNEQRREYCAENIQIINRNRDEAEMLTIHRKEDHRCIFGCRQDLPGSVGGRIRKKGEKNWKNRLFTGDCACRFCYPCLQIATIQDRCCLAVNR